jgi:hypothetical protein
MERFCYKVSGQANAALPIAAFIPCPGNISEKSLALVTEPGFSAKIARNISM